MADIIPTWGSGLASATQKEMLARRFAVMPRRLWLYRDGDECMNLTGGWRSVSIKITDKIGGGAAYIERRSGELFTQVTSGSAVLATTKKIPFYGFSALHAEFTVTRHPTGNDYESYQGLGVWTDWGVKFEDNRIAAAAIGRRSSTVEYADFVLPVDASVPCFVGFYMYTGARPEITLKKMWLE